MLEEQLAARYCGRVGRMFVCLEHGLGWTLPDVSGGDAEVGQGETSFLTGAQRPVLHMSTRRAMPFNHVSPAAGKCA